MKFGREMHDKIRRHITSALPKSHEPLGRRILIWFVLGSLATALAGVFVFTLLIVGLSLGLPDVRDFDKLAGVESTIIYDREGGVFYTIHGEENRKYVPLNEISEHLQEATVAIEDWEFYEHGGFDVSGLGAAILHDIFGIGPQRGGSTITQQLAKNAFLTPKKEYTRKMKELILAVRLERAYDKKKILELYLNRIPYGNNAYGAELASKIYFNKSAKDLTLSESVILAALPNKPTFYSPYGSNVYSKLDIEIDPADFGGKFPTSLNQLDENDYINGLVGREVAFSPTEKLFIPGRTDLILKRMTDLGYISEEEERIAINEIQKKEFNNYAEAMRSPHFVFYIRGILEEQFGKDAIAQGGLKVYTTIDPKMQSTAEQLVADQIKTSKELHGATNGALFSINPKTGEILAMVGSADYRDDEAHGKVNHVFRRRQPGSSFKPIVYAKAFLNRYAPATVLYDTPTNFGNNYVPQNYEGGFRGPMTIRSALGQSRNIPALKAYFLAGQQDEIIQLANRMGIASLKTGMDYGPPLAIGSGEVTLAEMVQAFSVFASNGTKRDYYAILRVESKKGEKLFERLPDDPQNRGTEVLDPQVAYLINNILSDKSVYLGPRLDVPGHITAAKTGTSNKEITPVKILPSNLWTMGYTPSMVTGVWVGNSDGSPMKANADGYNVAAPIWSKFMTEALKGSPNEEFPIPQGIKHVTVSKASGKLPNGQTDDSYRSNEIFASFSVPTELDDIYIAVDVNEKDNLLPNEYTPPEYIKKKVFFNHRDPISQYPRWQSGVVTWVENKLKAEPGFPGFPPTETTKMFTAETANSKPTIQIVSPAAFSTVEGDKLSINVDIDAPNGVAKVLFFLDNRSVPNSVQIREPYTGTIRFVGDIREGTHTITAKIYDKIGYTGEAKIEFQYVQGAALGEQP